MEKKTILILGISSFLGSNFAENLKSEYKVIGTYMFNPVSISGVTCIKCNIADKKFLEHIIYNFKPDITLYCIGMTSIIDCHDNPKLADALNTTGVFNASNISERHGSKFVLFSSSFVFQGDHQVYYESDTPVPLTVYGNSMASSEYYVQKSCLNYLIFRCCPLYGLSATPNQITFFERLNNYFFEEKEIILDDKIKTGYLDVWTFIDIVKKFLETKFVNRLFQVSTKDVMTKHEFATHYFTSISRNKSLLSKGDWQFPISKSLLTSNIQTGNFSFSMDVTNIESEYGAQMPTIKQSLQRMKKRLKGVDEIGKKNKASDDIKFI